MTPKLATALDAAVWTACPYVHQWVDWALKGDAQKMRPCKRCPQWESDPEGDKTQRMCRAITEEILKPAFLAYQSNDEQSHG